MIQNSTHVFVYTDIPYFVLRVQKDTMILNAQVLPIKEWNLFLIIGDELSSSRPIIRFFHWRRRVVERETPDPTRNGPRHRRQQQRRRRCRGPVARVPGQVVASWDRTRSSSSIRPTRDRPLLTTVPFYWPAIDRPPTTTSWTSQAHFVCEQHQQG